jgi:hypothetical protein
MVQQIRTITLAHELDAAWIIALWIAIHGGDPAPIEIAIDEGLAKEAAALTGRAAQAVKGVASTELTIPLLRERLQALGLKVENPPAGAKVTAESEPGCCVRTQRGLVCVNSGGVHKVSVTVHQ